jgi:hypothetical protein
MLSDFSAGFTTNGTVPPGIIAVDSQPPSNTAAQSTNPCQLFPLRLEITTFILPTPVEGIDGPAESADRPRCPPTV